MDKIRLEYDSIKRGVQGQTEPRVNRDRVQKAINQIVSYEPISSSSNRDELMFILERYNKYLNAEQQIAAKKLSGKEAKDMLFKNFEPVYSQDFVTLEKFFIEKKSQLDIIAKKTNSATVLNRIAFNDSLYGVEVPEQPKFVTTQPSIVSSNPQEKINDPSKLLAPVPLLAQKATPLLAPITAQKLIQNTLVSKYLPQYFTPADLSVRRNMTRLNKRSLLHEKGCLLTTNMFALYFRTVFNQTKQEPKIDIWIEGWDGLDYKLKYDQSVEYEILKYQKEVTIPINQSNNSAESFGIILNTPAEFTHKYTEHIVLRIKNPKNDLNCFLAVEVSVGDWKNVVYLSPYFVRMMQVCTEKLVDDPRLTSECIPMFDYVVPKEMSNIVPLCINKNDPYAATLHVQTRHGHFRVDLKWNQNLLRITASPKVIKYLQALFSLESIQ